MSDFDFNALYSVDGYRGVAFRATEFVTEYDEWEDSSDCFDCEGEGFWQVNEDEEEVECETCYGSGVVYYYDVIERTDTDRVICHMVGDDRDFTFDISELTKLDEDVCSCGQIGCGWGG